jgi:predicted dehydrogenase
MIRFGVIGYGYWGPNIVRNIRALDSACIAAVCDKSTAALSRVKKSYPDVHVTSDVDDLLQSPDIDAIAVITPVWTHFDLARRALQNGKHIFVEKPFTGAAWQAEELVELAERKRLKIMVDHTFLFTGAVKKIRSLIKENALGKLYYYDSTRVNLGLFQHDIDVLWDLAPHDLSIVDHLIGKRPDAIVATGAAHFGELTDVAHLTAYYPDNVIVHINVNWLSPVKVRTTLIGGENKMLLWNDLEADEKIKVYDRGVNMTSGEGVYDLLVSYRSGDIWSPKIEMTEALKEELGYFVSCIENGETPFNDGQAGLRVVRMLEAADQSLMLKGEAVYA